MDDVGPAVSQKGSGHLADRRCRMMQDLVAQLVTHACRIPTDDHDPVTAPGEPVGRLADVALHAGEPVAAHDLDHREARKVRRFGLDARLVIGGCHTVPLGWMTKGPWRTPQWARSLDIGASCHRSAAGLGLSCPTGRVVPGERNCRLKPQRGRPVSYTHLRAHETV